MELSLSIIDTLAEMICGNDPYSNFPYRSSFYLTRFFRGIDLKYVHDGSTRSSWVAGVLEELNKEQSSDPDLLPSKLKSVIEYLLNPKHFMDPLKNHDLAIEQVNQILSIQRLIIKKDENTGDVELCKIREGYISTSTDADEVEKTIIFSPSVFRVPDKSVETDLVAVMMPFSKDFDDALDSIRAACSSADLTCTRVDDIWNHSEVIQDIFELIFCSYIVVVDFSGKNSNVFYEAGIAHTLGKHVVPITQYEDDIPFDLRHHRYIKYLNNTQGLVELRAQLELRLKALKS